MREKKTLQEALADLSVATDDLVAAVDRALRLTSFSRWFDRQLRRWPRLYAWLSR